MNDPPHQRAYCAFYAYLEMVFVRKTWNVCKCNPFTPPPLLLFPFDYHDYYNYYGCLWASVSRETQKSLKCKFASFTDMSSPAFPLMFDSILCAHYPNWTSHNGAGPQNTLHTRNVQTKQAGRKCVQLFTRVCPCVTPVQLLLADGWAVCRT